MGCYTLHPYNLHSMLCALHSQLMGGSLVCPAFSNLVTRKLKFTITSKGAKPTLLLAWRKLWQSLGKHNSMTNLDTVARTCCDTIGVNAIFDDVIAACITKVIIYTKKLLNSDWLRKECKMCNTSAKMQITNAFWLVKNTKETNRNQSD